MTTINRRRTYVPLTSAAPSTTNANAIAKRRIIGRPNALPTTRTATALSTVTVPGLRVKKVTDLLALPAIAPHLVQLLALLTLDSHAGLTVGELVGVDAVDVLAGGDGRIRPGEPEVPDLRPELLVDRFGGCLADRRIAVGLDGVQRLVDDRVLEAAEVQRRRPDRGRRHALPPQPLLVRVGATVVAPALGLERAGEGEADVLALLDRRDRGLDLVAEGVVPHRDHQLVRLHVERVVRGVEGEGDVLGARGREALVHVDLRCRD